MWFTCAAGEPNSKHSFGESREKDWKETERDGMGAEEREIKACEVKLEGHPLSAFSLTA